MLIAVSTVLDWTLEEWKNATAAVGSVATAAALVVGGWWALRRYQRTPESRAFFNVGVQLAWEESVVGDKHSFVRARITVKNVGGKTHVMQATRGDEESVVGCWWLDGHAINDALALAKGYANWFDSPVVAAAVLPSDFEMRPQDEWEETLLFAAPPDAEAVRVSALILVDTPDPNDNELTASAVLVRVAKQ